MNWHRSKRPAALLLNVGETGLAFGKVLCDMIASSWASDRFFMGSPPDLLGVRAPNYFLENARRSIQHSDAGIQTATTRGWAIALRGGTLAHWKVGECRRLESLRCVKVLSAPGAR
jgi:hypothetical protein